MRKLLVKLIFLLLATSAYTQDISGVWAGIMYNENRFYNSYFYLEIKQKDRAVWGVFSRSDSLVNNNKDCICNISGLAPKNPSAKLELDMDRSFISKTYNANNFRYQACEFMAHIDFHYLLEEGIEYMIGEWFTQHDHSGLNRNKGGYLVLQHLSTSSEKDLDSYFKNLDKLVQKGAAAGNKKAMIPEDISLASDKEKKLLGIWKQFLVKIK